MGKAIPAQHPAVVLRSHYRQLRALLAIAMIAVVGLTATVVILATNDDRDTSAGSATQLSAPGPTGGVSHARWNPRESRRFTSHDSHHFSRLARGLRRRAPAGTPRPRSPAG